MLGWLLALVLMLGLVAPVRAATINHTFAEVNTNQTTTSATYVDVSGLAIASGSFTTGKKYLLVATAQVGNGTSGVDVGVQLVHGSTAFGESEAVIDTINSTARWPYQFFTVWTAVAAEGVKVQFKSNGTNTTNLNFGSLLAINLSDDVIENTDWCFAERTTDDAVATSTTYTAGASCTITPSGASDWLVMTYYQGSMSSAGEMESRMNRSGEAADTTVRYSHQPRVTTGVINQGVLARVFSLTNASNTFKEEATKFAGTHTRLHSNVLMLNLSKFKASAFAYTDADVALSTTDFSVNAQTISITPTSLGNVWIGGHWLFDHNSTATTGEMRVQVDNADQPAGQTAAIYPFQWDGTTTGNIPLILSTVASLSAAAHTIDLDVSGSSASSTAEGRSMWAVTMELAASPLDQSQGAFLQ